MGKRQNCPPSSSCSSDDYPQWQRIFDTLVKILQSLQSENETLVEGHKFLEKYAHIQHENFSWKVQYLESHIAQLKKETQKGRKMYQSKLDLMVALKEEEAMRYKKQCELADTDLEDFLACVEALSAELSELKAKHKSKEAGKDSRSGDNSKQAERCPAVLEEEIRMLKHSCKKLSLKKKAYKKLSSEKEAEVSALVAEKDFVWNQLKVMESDYSDKLKEKKIEVEHCKEAIEKLRHNLMELQESINEKGKIIAKLKDTHELDMRRHTEEAQQANEKIERLQLDNEELGSVSIEKDETIDRLKRELARHTQEAQQANEKIEQLQLDKEELGSVAIEKDETIDRLKRELANLEMDVWNCNIEKSRLPKKNDPILLLESNPRKGSRKRMSESAKQATSKNIRHISDGSSLLPASAPAHGLVRCSSKRKPVSDLPLDRPALFHSNFKVPRLKYSTRSSVT